MPASQYCAASISRSRPDRQPCRPCTRVSWQGLKAREMRMVARTCAMRRLSDYLQLRGARRKTCCAGVPPPPWGRCRTPPAHTRWATAPCPAALQVQASAGVSGCQFVAFSKEKNAAHALHALERGCMSPQRCPDKALQHVGVQFARSSAPGCLWAGVAASQVGQPCRTDICTCRCIQMRRTFQNFNSVQAAVLLVHRRLPRCLEAGLQQGGLMSCWDLASQCCTCRAHGATMTAKAAHLPQSRPNKVGCVMRLCGQTPRRSGPIAVSTSISWSWCATGSSGGRGPVSSSRCTLASFSRTPLAACAPTAGQSTAAHAASAASRLTEADRACGRHERCCMPRTPKFCC